MSDQRGGFGRRNFLKGAGIAAGALAADLPPAAATAETPAAAPPDPIAHLTLTESEAAFLTAAVDTLIPADALSPSASEVGVVTFIDRQLAGAWGGGVRLYRSGPFLPGTPEQGYQLPLTPRQFFQAGIADADRWAKAQFGRSFDRLTPPQRIAALQQIEAGKAEFDGIPAADFFEALLQIVMEGFFADPIHGGNRGKAGWTMIGFPGLPAFYAGSVASHVGKRFEAAPKSIADFL